MDRNLPGPDQRASLEPHELKLLVESIRNTKDAIGNVLKIPNQCEIANKTVARKSIVVKKEIKINEYFSEDNLCTKRPGNGISAMKWNGIIGKKSRREYKIDDLIDDNFTKMLINKIISLLNDLHFIFWHDGFKLILKLNFLLLTFLFFLIVIVSNNIFEFTPWGQIEYVHDVITDKDKLFLEVEEKFHILRYLVVYPAYFFSNILKIEITKTYSFYIIFVLFYTSVIWKRICNYKLANKFETFIKCIIPLSLAFIINGRFAFSLLGISILIFGILLRRESKNYYYF